MCPFVFAYRLQASSSLSRTIVRCSSIKMTSPDFGRPDSGLVGLDGLEPSTSRLSGVRSSHLSYRPVFLRYFSSSISQGSLLDGGDEGIRTLDPLLAGQVLSQLSYTPILSEEWRVKSEKWKVFASLFSLLFRVCISGLLIESWQLNNKIYQHRVLIHIYQVFCPNLTTKSQERLALLASRSP